MKTISIATGCELGRMVRSKQGHDKDDYFAIVGIVDEKHVLIADGKSRKLEKPKKKQVKHLRLRPTVLADIAKALEAGQPLTDSDLHKALRAAAEQDALNYIGPQGRSYQKEECAFVQE